MAKRELYEGIKLYADGEGDLWVTVGGSTYLITNARDPRPGLKALWWASADDTESLVESGALTEITPKRKAQPKAPKGSAAPAPADNRPRKGDTVRVLPGSVALWAPVGSTFVVDSVHESPSPYDDQHWYAKSAGGVGSTGVWGTFLEIVPDAKVPDAKVPDAVRREIKQLQIEALEAALEALRR